MMRKNLRQAGPGTVLWAAAALSMAAVTGGCGITGVTTANTEDLSEWFTVTSPAFRDTGDLPARFGCRSYSGGQGRIPPLRWSGAPSPATQTFAIVADDPDAPAGAYVHWVIANVGDGTTNELVEGARPDKAVEALNTSKKTAYVPPCPPKGQRHRYRFTIYALDERVPLKQGASLQDALNAIAKATIGRGRITGNFGTR